MIVKYKTFSSGHFFYNCSRTHEGEPADQRSSSAQSIQKMLKKRKNYPAERKRHLVHTINLRNPRSPQKKKSKLTVTPIVGKVTNKAAVGKAAAQTRMIDNTAVAQTSTTGNNDDVKSIVKVITVTTNVVANADLDDKVAADAVSRTGLADNNDDDNEIIKVTTKAAVNADADGKVERNDVGSKCYICDGLSLLLDWDFECTTSCNFR